MMQANPTLTRSTSLKTRSRSGQRWRLVIALAVLLLLGAVGWYWYSTQNIDVSRTRMSQQGIFQGTYVPSTDPIPVEQEHTWRLRLQNADGTPVSGAIISVHGDMPGHGHGMATEPVVRPAADTGEYIVEDMHFLMAGRWYVEFAVQGDGKQDTLRFDLRVE